MLARSACDVVRDVFKAAAHGVAMAFLLLMVALLCAFLVVMPYILLLIIKCMHAEQALVEGSMHWPATTCKVTGAAVIRDRMTAGDTPEFVSHQVDVPVAFGNFTAVAHRYALTPLAHDHFSLCSDAENFAARFVPGRMVPCWVSTDQTRVKLDPTEAPPVEGAEIVAWLLAWAMLLLVAGLPTALNLMTCRIELSRRAFWRCYATCVAVAYVATAAAVAATPILVGSGPGDAQLRPPSEELPCMQQPCAAQDCSSNGPLHASKLKSWSGVMGMIAGGLFVCWLQKVRSLRWARGLYDPRHSAQTEALITAKRIHEVVDSEGGSTTYHLLSYHFTAVNARGEASEHISVVGAPVEHDVYSALSEGQSAPVRYKRSKPTKHLLAHAAITQARCDASSATPLFISAGCCLAPMLVLGVMASQQRSGLSLAALDILFAWLQGMAIGAPLVVCAAACCCGKGKTGVLAVRQAEGASVLAPIRQLSNGLRRQLSRDRMADGGGALLPTGVARSDAAEHEDTEDLSARMLGGVFEVRQASPGGEGEGDVRVGGGDRRSVWILFGVLTPLLTALCVVLLAGVLTEQRVAASSASWPRAECTVAQPPRITTTKHSFSRIHQVSVPVEFEPSARLGNAPAVHTVAHRFPTGCPRLLWEPRLRAERFLGRLASSKLHGRTDDRSDLAPGDRIDCWFAPAEPRQVRLTPPLEGTPLEVHHAALIGLMLLCFALWAHVAPAVCCLPSRNPQHGVRWGATLATFACHALLFVVFAALCIGIASVLAATMQVAPLDVADGSC